MDLQINVCHQVWNIFSYYFYRCFPYFLFLVSHYIYVGILGIVLLISEQFSFCLWSFPLFWIGYMCLSKGSLKSAMVLTCVMKFLFWILYFSSLWVVNYRLRYSLETSCMLRHCPPILLYSLKDSFCSWEYV